MTLYILANIYGLTILQGNLSSSLIFGTIPLSDPLAVLQMIFAGALISTNIIVGASIITMFYFLLEEEFFVHGFVLLI